jgi:hypothetical protein
MQINPYPCSTEPMRIQTRVICQSEDLRLFREAATHYKNPTRARLKTHSIEVTLGFVANRGYKCRAGRHLRDPFQAHRQHLAARKLASSVESIAQGGCHVIAR